MYKQNTLKKKPNLSIVERGRNIYTNMARSKFFPIENHTNLSPDTQVFTGYFHANCCQTEF